MQQCFGSYGSNRLQVVFILKFRCIPNGKDTWNRRMARFRDFPSLCCRAPPTTTTTKNFFMLWVRANPRPLFFLRTPHICWAKWSRICSNSKHSQDITIVTQLLKISQPCYISAMLRGRANLRPLYPTNMGGPQEEKWSQICSNSKHSREIA